MEWDIRNVIELIKDSLGYIIALVLVFLIVMYVISLQIVSGPSMQPTYYTQDILILNKLHYRFFKPNRFDIVALEDAKGALIIKRIIALPGDTVEYRSNELYINGEKIEEPFKTGSETEDWNLETLSIDKIPEDYYFFLGDNRADSWDSRDPDIGLVHRDELLGKVMIRIWRMHKEEEG